MKQICPSPPLHGLPLPLGWRRCSVVETLVYGWRTFLDLHLIYSWHLTTSWVVSTIGQPTSPTQPSIPLGSIKWVVIHGLRAWRPLNGRPGKLLRTINKVNRLNQTMKSNQLNQIKVKSKHPSIHIQRSNVWGNARHWTYLKLNWKLSSSEMSTKCTFATLANLRGINHLIIIIIFHLSNSFLFRTFANCSQRWRYFITNHPQQSKYGRTISWLQKCVHAETQER